MLALLRKGTISAPLIYSNTTFSSEMTLNPVVPRDTNTLLTLGYHYDPLDYVLSGVNVLFEPHIYTWHGGGLV